MAASGTISLYPTDLREAETYFEGRKMFVRRLKFTGFTGGGASNTITTTLLGFKKFVGCSGFYDATNGKIIPAAVDPTANVVLLGAGASLAVGDVSNVTGYMTVWGY